MMEALTLAERLRLAEGNVLTDSVSGRKLVLDPAGVAFYDVFTRHGTGPDALRELTTRFLIPPDRAAVDYAAFVALIDQGQRCEGSILPGAHHAVLEPTSACNGQCPHCYHNEHGTRWPDDQFARILDQVQRGGIKSVSITGGEVFSAHFTDKFFALAAQLRDRDVTVASVSTNATFLTEDVRDKILTTLPTTTVFRISLDALRGPLLDRIRPGYRHLPDPYAPIADLDTAGYPLVCTTNLFGEQTIDTVLEIGEHLRRYANLRAWNLRMAVPVHFGTGERTDNPARRRQLFGTRPKPTLGLRFYAAVLREHARDPYPYDVRMGNHLMTSALRNPHVLAAKGDGHPCREDAALVTLKASGQVTQCPILTELAPELTMGSLHDDRDVLAPGFEDDLPLTGLHTKDMGCHTCPLLTVCGGGCRLYALGYDQGLTGCDLPARALLTWMVTDPDGLLREHWPTYHARLLSLLPDVERVTAEAAAGGHR
jgi:radical SAM protein with 4Fe4S-binding SPASM domain